MKRTYLVATLYGWASAIFLLVVTSACLALAIRFFSLANSTIFYGSFIIGLFILCISGFIAGAKGKEKGWLLGIMVGVGCMGTTFFIQYVGLDVGFTLQQVLYHATYIVAAIVGAIAGVNLTNQTVQTK